MQFVIIAHDGNDAEALPRRLAVREAHLKVCESARDNGEQLMACALLSDAGNMCGSIAVVDFPSRAELDAWLKTEPYMLGNVWQDVQIIPCKIGPAFVKK